MLFRSKLRKQPDKNQIALVSVHEAGHTILSSLLLNQIPTEVYSNGVASNHGMTHINSGRGFVSMDTLKPWLAVYYGGFVAEKLIFGEKLITDGSAEDLSEVTYLAVNSIKEKGLGSFPARHFVTDNFPDVLKNSQHEMDTETKEWLSEALKLAESTLKREIVLLTRMSEALFNKTKLHKDEIQSLLVKHAVKIDIKTVLEKDNTYEALLKSKVFELGEANHKLNGHIKAI